LNKQLDGQGGHLMRFAIAIEHLHSGMESSEIAQLFQSQSDYSYEKSLGFVEDAQKRSYKPFKCKTIQTLGFCFPNCGRHNA
jgi:DNA primase large subunit